MQLSWALDCLPSAQGLYVRNLYDIDVPPTLVSFAVDVAKEKDIITPELKKAEASWYG